MNEIPTNLIAEFQKLREETSGISQILMTTHISSSSSTDETLKLIAESLRSIRSEMTEIKVNQKKDNDEQNQQITKSVHKVLDELRFARMEIAEVKKQQKEDRKEMENIRTITRQIQETLRNPKIVELCGYWTLSPKESRCSNVQTLAKKHHFSEEGDMLAWSFWKDKRPHLFSKMRIGSNECKIREDGKIEIRSKEYKFEFEVKEKKLTIGCDDVKAVYIKSNA